MVSPRRPQEWTSGPLSRCNRLDGKNHLVKIMAWNVYIIKSEVKNRYYKGYCQDFEARIKDHNAGKVKSTKAYRPWSECYLEGNECRSG